MPVFPQSKPPILHPEDVSGLLTVLPLPDRLRILEETAKKRSGFGAAEDVRERIYKERLASGGIRYFEPQRQQIGPLSFTKRGALVLGGSRSGKTVTGAAEVVYRLLGEHPYKPVPKGDVLIWCCSQDLPGVTDQPHKQLEELRRWIPQESLRGGNWNLAYSPMARTLHGQNGRGEWTILFKGYDQGLLKFESDAIHHCWMDEECEDEGIFNAIQTRLVDYNGTWMMTATPVLSLQGKGWIEKLWDRRNDPDISYDTYRLFPYDNPYLSSEILDEIFSGFSEEERKVRATGAFARVMGRVLSEFDALRHIVHGEPLPLPEWRHYMILDPGGKNPTAALWAAVDPHANLWLYGEYYVREQLPHYHMACLHQMYKAFCSAMPDGNGRPVRALDDLTVLVDPAIRARERTISHGRMDRSALEEYVLAAQELGAHWFRPRIASNADVFAWRVKRYFHHDKVFLYDHLKWLPWEIEKWTYERPSQGIRGQERPLPERPVDRDDHLVSCLRYIVNELPEPIPPEAPLLTPLERHWAEVRSYSSGAPQDYEALEE